MSGCNSDDSLPYDTVRDAGGMVLTDTDCPTAETQISGGAADGLPAKGQTEFERVEAEVELWITRHRLAGDPFVTAEVVPRNGEVWSRANDGTVIVEKVEDYMVLVTISDSSGCPEIPLSSGGIPVIYRVDN